MFYVTRSASGAIQSVSRSPAPDAQALDEQHPDVQQFFNVKASGLDESDADFVRVLEDLIDTLITKNIIRHTDLPAAAQKKLILRKGLRNRLKSALNLLDEDRPIL
jgi:hypothetical protein